MRARPGSPFLTNAAMTRGAAIRVSFRESNETPILTTVVGKHSLHAGMQNAVLEYAPARRGENDPLRAASRRFGQDRISGTRNINGAPGSLPGAPTNDLQGAPDNKTSMFSIASCQQMKPSSNGQDATHSVFFSIRTVLMKPAYGASPGMTSTYMVAILPDMALSSAQVS